MAISQKFMKKINFFPNKMLYGGTFSSMISIFLLYIVKVQGSVLKWMLDLSIFPYFEHDSFRVLNPP